jgi:hypothetical protein
MDVYYRALKRAATVRIHTEGTTRSVPKRQDEEMAAALGDDPSELFSYLFRRGYKAGWKSQTGFVGAWGFSRAVWPDAVDEG